MKVVFWLFFSIAIMSLKGQCQQMDKFGGEMSTSILDIKEEKTFPTVTPGTINKTQKSKKRPGVGLMPVPPPTLLNTSMNSANQSDVKVSEFMESTMTSDAGQGYRNKSSASVPRKGVKDVPLIIINNSSDSLTKLVSKDGMSKNLENEMDNKTKTFEKKNPSKENLDSLMNTTNFPENVSYTSGKHSDRNISSFEEHLKNTNATEGGSTFLSSNITARVNSNNSNEMQNASIRNDSGLVTDFHDTVIKNASATIFNPQPTLISKNSTSFVKETLNDSALHLTIPMNPNNANSTLSLSKPSTASVEGEGVNGYQSGNAALVAAVIIVIAVCSLVGFITYKRLHAYWYRRHYSRVDYLIDGLYEM